MTDIYADFVDLADELVNEFGVAATITRYTSPQQNTPVMALRKTLKRSRSDQDNIAILGETFLIPAKQLDFELDNTMTVTIGSEVYAIRDVPKKIAPGPTTVLWEITVQS